MAESLANFRKAIEMAPDNARYHLGLAFILETGSLRIKNASSDPPPTKSSEIASTKPENENSKNKEVKQSQDKQDGLSSVTAKAIAILKKHLKGKDAKTCANHPEILCDFWIEEAISENWEAYELAQKDDIKITRKPVCNYLNSLVSYESGKSYIRLLGVRKSLAQIEQDKINQINDHIKKLDSLPNGIITPIILPLDRPQPLGELLATGCEVDFDIDGDGGLEHCPWVRPETGILAWDPHGTGEIISGRQLFGSVTWWMFWEDGYHALDALDDNRDGALTGDELLGLVVWFDLNSNGVSEPGEVVPVEKLGIERLESRHTTHVGECPANLGGARLRNGRILPTYDWLVKPMKKTLNAAIRKPSEVCPTALANHQ